MVGFRFALVAIGCLALSGCSTLGSGPTGSDIDAWGASVRGKSKEQVLGCMGPPSSNGAVGDTEVWKYAAEEYGGSDGKVLHWQCEILVSFKNGVAASVKYAGDEGWLSGRMRACENMLKRCE